MLGCFGVLAAIIVVIVIIAVIVSSGGGSDDKDTATKVSGSAETSELASEEPAQTVFKIGDTASFDGYDISVNSIETNEGSEYEEPEEGKEFVVINLTITNNTEEKQSFNPLDFEVNEDGVSSSAGFNYLHGVETLNSGDLDPGASITGNLVAEVRSDATLKLRYNPILSDQEIDFELR